MTATESSLPTISSTSKCTKTRTVTVDPEPVTVTVTPSAPATSSVDGNDVGVAEYTPSSYSLSSAVETSAPAPTPEVVTVYTTSHIVSTAVKTSTEVDSVGSSTERVVTEVVTIGTTVCPVTATQTPAGTPSVASVAVDTPVYTPAPEVTQYTTSHIVSTAVKTSTSVDVDGSSKEHVVTEVVTIGTTVCPVTATQTPAGTPSVAVDTPVYTPVSASTPYGADVQGAAVPSSSSALFAVDTPIYTPVAPSFAVDTPIYTPVGTPSVAVDVPVYTPAPASDAGVEGANATPSFAVDTPIYTPVDVPSVAVDTPVYTPAPVASTPATDAGVEGANAVSTPSVAVDVPVYTPASTPITWAQTTFATSAAASTPSSSSSSGLLTTVGSTVSTLSETLTGEATYYSGNIASGTCSFSGYTLPSDIFGTALSLTNWDTASNCGACVNVKGSSGKTIKAMIVDKCADCSDNSLDLFQDAFSSLDALATGVLDITWEIVECGIETALELVNKDGVSANWFSMQVVNSNLPVSALHVSVDGGSTWTETTRTDYNFFEYEQGFATDLVDIKVTSSTGKEVITKNVTVASSQSHTCESNF